MQVQRCPECGIRLKTNYCDVCMKKVPFRGIPTKQTFQHYEGSSAHRTERGHECVSFDTPEKKKRTATRKNGDVQATKKTVKISAIILALLSLIPTLFGIVEDLIPNEPDYRYEDFVEVGEIEAGNVPAIETKELYNDGSIIVTADFAALYYDDYTVFMTVINESDSDIVVGTDLLSVNGYMHSGSLYAEADAGEIVQESLQLYTWELNQACIDEVAEIAFHLNIYDQHDYSDIARSELITIETDAADTYEAPMPPSGWELYQDDKISVELISTAVYYGDLELQFYIENLSGQQLCVNVPTIFVNGQEATGIFWSNLRPGTRALASTYLYDIYDENGEAINGLEQVDEIALDIHMEYMEDWYVAETVNETVTFNPNELSPVFG